MKLPNKKWAALLGAIAACSLVLPATSASAEAPIISPVSADVAIATDGATHVAIAPCTAVGTTTGSRLTVALAGTATATGAVAVRIRCGIVQDNAVVFESTNALPGSAAATAKNGSIDLAPYHTCADVYALFVDGAEASRNNCPD